MFHPFLLETPNIMLTKYMLVRSWDFHQTMEHVIRSRMTLKRVPMMRMRNNNKFKPKLFFYPQHQCCNVAPVYSKNLQSNTYMLETIVLLHEHKLCKKL